MLTGLFKDRARARIDSGFTPEQALARLMTTRMVARHHPVRSAEIGPFVADYVFRAKSLIVELEPCNRTALERLPARVAFLNELGYSVLHVSRRELRNNPARVLAQISAALN